MATSLLTGHGLPRRWAGRQRFALLQTAFGDGRDFLAVWSAWRDDARRGERLQVVAIAPRPLAREDLRRALAGSPWPEQAAALIAAWPPLMPGLQLLNFDQGRVRLLLALGPVRRWLPQLEGRIDAFSLDEDTAWDGAPALTKALGRLAAPEATIAWPASVPDVAERLRPVGFEWQGRTEGPAPLDVARFAPRFQPRATPARFAGAAGAREALVLGAGLAGASVARALAADGWHCRVLDRHPLPAMETSGQAGGLFHPVVHPGDGLHARLHRAAALWMARELHAASADGLPAEAGAVSGLLRLVPGAALAELQHLAHRDALPADLARPVDAAQAAHLAGLPVPNTAWHFPQAGWVDTVAWVRQRLALPGIHFRGGVQVQSLRSSAAGWQVLDAQGAVIDQAPVLVLACAGDLPRLLPPLAPALMAVRGQTSRLLAQANLPRPRLPLAGSGYALALPDGGLLCGASHHPGDADATLREADHRHNLAQLRRLTGFDGPLPEPALLGGRVGWRQTTADRLPLVGGVPAAWVAPPTPARTADQPRRVPRVPGLFVLGALASRGLTTAALAAEALAAGLCGAPLPLEADLLDLLDLGRLPARQARRDQRGA